MTATQQNTEEAVIERCQMTRGRCPRLPGHAVMMRQDHFECSACGDTGHRPCAYFDCPDRRPRSDA